MTTVSIIGSGNMGSAIAGVVEKGGNTAQVLGTDAVDQAVTGDIVVLAVPYPAFGEVLAQRGDQLAGRVVVDITNPLNFETFDSLTVAADGSAAAELAEKLPSSKVLKAFNTNFAATLSSGQVAGLQTTVTIAGDDADAKAALAAVVTAGGLRAIDAGALSRARELEAIGFLQITLAAAEKISWAGGFTLQP
ncbi:NADPH-dependent F420 reductase [Cumulibacter manganitolerans]|uniref:NADPH-dependent F420 reductase n=1 Tax=Cumulibacter manganitolerans TaxID=1884992 RepID=UPI001296B16A|nr:NAD(P)-binding domain-containing protein [Cumulibacter manganitolerans]